MDLKIFGIGIAVTFALIALSAIILYLSFRIKSTFENDKSVKVQIAKTLLIVGVLFLAGGMFYYFAQAMSSGKQADDAMIKNQSISKDGLAMLTVSYTEKVNTGDDYTIAFAIKSLSTGVIHNATIRIGGVSLLGAKTNYNIFGDTLIIGDILPGETDGKLILKAPTYATGLEGALILLSPDIDSVTTSFRISVIDTGRPLAAVTPTPIVNKTNQSKPHFDGTLPSEPIDSQNSAPAPVETTMQNTNISNQTTNVSNDIANNTTNTNTTTSNNSTNSTGNLPLPPSTNDSTNTVNNSNNTTNNNTNSTSGTPNATVTETPNFTYIPTPTKTPENMNII